MAVASPCLSLSLYLYLFSFSFPVFLPFLTHPSLVLFVLLPCTESIQHSTHARMCTYTCAYTKCVSCFHSMCTILHLLLVLLRLFFSSRPVPSSLLPIALTDARVDSRATTYVCLDLKIVRLWSLRAERGVPNEPEIRSQPRTRER